MAGEALRTWPTLCDFFTKDKYGNNNSGLRTAADGAAAAANGDSRCCRLARRDWGFWSAMRCRNVRLEQRFSIQRQL
jgi:hypothetical protein